MDGGGVVAQSEPHAPQREELGVTRYTAQVPRVSPEPT